MQQCSIKLGHELAMQQQVNKQLMQRKQEVEWQLMAAVAEVCLLLCWLESRMKRQQVNKQLMQRKQEVEWQLVAAEMCLLLYWLGSCMERQQWLWQRLHAHRTASAAGANTACSYPSGCPWV